MPGYIGESGFNDLIHACIGSAIAFVVSFVVCYILYKDKTSADKGIEQASTGAESKSIVKESAGVEAH